MHRDKLPLDHGMLFIYPNNQHVTMWMKNTLIPLDMIFIRQNGEIEQIVRKTTPNSLKYISSNNPQHHKSGKWSVIVVVISF